MIFIYSEESVEANGKQISQTNTQVCLGVKLDENLSWASHIEIIWEKASSGIDMYRALCSNEYFRIL